MLMTNLLDLVSVISRMTKVLELSALPFGFSPTYLNLDYSGYHKKQIQ